MAQMNVCNVKEVAGGPVMNLHRIITRLCSTDRCGQINANISLWQLDV